MRFSGLQLKVLKLAKKNFSHFLPCYFKQCSFIAGLGSEEGNDNLLSYKLVRDTGTNCICIQLCWTTKLFLTHNSAWIFRFVRLRRIKVINFSFDLASAQCRIFIVRQNYFLSNIWDVLLIVLMGVARLIVMELNVVWIHKTNWLRII